MGDTRKKRSIRQFCGQGITFPYELWVGGVRNLNLRVRTDGSVRLSVPRGTDMRTVDRFIESNLAKITEAVEKMKQRKARTTSDDILYRDGGKVPYLGEYLTLRVLRDATVKRSSVRLNEPDRTLNVRLPLEAPEEKIAEAVLRWKRERLCEILSYYENRMPERFGETLTNSVPSGAHPAYIGAPNEITVRAMRSRWGSCHTSKGKLTFNLWLIHAPAACIEYVVTHENAHFLFADHSANFHALMTKVMPDWKQRRTELEKWTENMD